MDGDFGRVELTPGGAFEAGAYASFTLTYTAGVYGMDDLGCLEIRFRFACDQSPLQATDPVAEGFVTAVASNGARVQLRYDPRGGLRPWFKSLRATIVGGGLVEGDTISLVLGDTRRGSRGLRLQTFAEDPFEFRTLVDVFSTNSFVPLPSPRIAITSGTPHSWEVVLPTLRRPGEEFRLSLASKDRWGNPAPGYSGELFLSSSLPVDGLPGSVRLDAGESTTVVDGLSCAREGVVTIEVRGVDGGDGGGGGGKGDGGKGIVPLATSNALVVSSVHGFRHFWADLHGQSGETIGTGTARGYFEFARDRAFLDVAAHQGNDFQVTSDFWGELVDLTAEFHEPGRFVTLLGYEWSGNTAVGGDRNVYFSGPRGRIRRSSHALIPPHDDPGTDCRTATALFEALVADDPGSGDGVLVFAHAGGRYADVASHHDGRVEHSVEVHSAWGTFEWLLWDALDAGYRVGVVANSDDHKGRPGASYPGASKFGAKGGLTCVLAGELTRDSVFSALKRRHHYATTGTRLFLDVRVELEQEGTVFGEDPAVFGQAGGSRTREAQMGDIVRLESGGATIVVKVVAGSPVERVDVLDGRDLLESLRAHEFRGGGRKQGATGELDRLRVTWEGAEYRARRRNVAWRGTAEFPGNEIERVDPINFWNADFPLRVESRDRVAWDSVTAGNFQGFDVVLVKPRDGLLRFSSSQVDFEVPLDEVHGEDRVWRAGGLGKLVKVFRLPTKPSPSSLEVKKEVRVRDGCEAKLLARVTLENGHQAWSSPVYLFW
ncbi:MAG: DUF3604 domain-containing protein [Promethearchaeota archaeon]